MTEEMAIRILSDIASPVVGRYLAECVAQRLYQVLSKLDKEGTDHLLRRISQSEEQAALPG